MLIEFPSFWFEEKAKGSYLLLAPSSNVRNFVHQNHRASHFTGRAKCGMSDGN